MEDFGMKLPDAVLACKLLDSASLSVDDRKLALALGKDMKFSDKKSALKRLFNKASSTDIPNLAIKDEEAFYSKLKSRNSFKNKSISKNKQQNNPLDKNGKISKCIICQSIMHWAGKCPHRNESVNISQENNSDSENTDEEINIVLFTENESNNEIFVAEALKLAVIDIACSKTVAGEDWYNDYINDILKTDKEKLQISKSSTSFKFGDGHKVRPFKKVTVPASIGA